MHLETGACFNYDKTNHIFRDYKEPPRLLVRQNQGLNRDQAPTRVYAMNQKDPDASPSIIEGNMLILTMMQKC